MTLNLNIEDHIHDIITQWVIEGRMFTAFEVSLAVKERGVRQRHRNLRDYVHQVVSRVGGSPGGYTRTLMDVGAPSPAWVYHPLDADPNDYRPLDRTEHGRRRNAPATPLPAGAFGADRRGRLCIPVRLLLKIGVAPGQRVSVRCDENGEKVLVSKASSARRARSDTSYTVEPHGNVRITRGTLERAGLNGLTAYRIEHGRNGIRVRKFS